MYEGQLNQVFMNILANAIDALDESNIGRSFAETHLTRLYQTYARFVLDCIRGMKANCWLKPASL